MTSKRFKLYRDTAPMNAIQCRMARIATGITIRDLAQRAEVAVDTVTRLERGEVLRRRTVTAMRVVLEEAGAIFIEDEAAGTFGVMVRKETEHG